MAAPEEILAAAADLSERSGLRFLVSDRPVHGTQLYVVYAPEHPLPDRYTATAGTVGFRVPHNFPDAHPEDSFFIQPAEIKLKIADGVRNSIDIHRAGVTADYVKGTELNGALALVFSWHIWDRRPWNRKKHNLFDHYTHSLRRFEQPEHDGP